jgi:hypothetical protein
MLLGAALGRPRPHRKILQQYSARWQPYMCPEAHFFKPAADARGPDGRGGPDPPVPKGLPAPIGPNHSYRTSGAKTLVVGACALTDRCRRSRVVSFPTNGRLRCGHQHRSVFPAEFSLDLFLYGYTVPGPSPEPTTAFFFFWLLTIRMTMMITPMIPSRKTAPIMRKTTPTVLKTAPGPIFSRRFVS